jgi:cation diffusion facilitator family transporter
VEYSLEQRKQQTRSITLWGVLVNVVLAITKLVGGVLGHSAALLADGIHSLSDLASDGMVLLAARHAGEDADDDHPYGHARFETLATVALGMLLILVGVGIAYDAITHLLDDAVREIPQFYTLYIAALSIVSKEVLFHLTKSVSVRLRSKMLEANAWHHRTDAISSIVVLIGIGGAMMGLPALDAYAALVVAIMVIKIGGDLSYQSLMELVDTALEPELLAQIKQKILAVEDVRELHMLRSRRMGHNALIDVHILVSPKLSVSEGHHISETVEREIINNFEEINDVTGHIDPEDDETKASCDHLPLRSELVQTLKQACAAVPELDAIDDITLHYLDGQIAVEASLPLDRLSDIARSQQLKTSFRDICLQIDCVGSASLKFS